MSLPMLAAYILGGRLPNGFTAPSSMTYAELQDAIAAARFDTHLPGVAAWLEIAEADIATRVDPAILHADLDALPTGEECAVELQIWRAAKDEAEL